MNGIQSTLITLILPVIFPLADVLADSGYAAMTASAKKVTVKVKSPKAASSNSDSDKDVSRHVRISETDSAAFTPMAPYVRFSGYDKAAGASKETFLVTNSSDYEICGVKVRIEYLDINDRQIHRREISITSLSVPAGETRMVEIPTFDSQKSYYYYRSAVPRKRATPYKVRMRLTGVMISK